MEAGGAEVVDNKVEAADHDAEVAVDGVLANSPELPLPSRPALPSQLALSQSRARMSLRQQHMLPQFELSWYSFHPPFQGLLGRTCSSINSCN